MKNFHNISIFNVFIRIIIMLGMISCEKLIETDFPNNQLATGQVFEDEQTAEAALAGLYSGLWNNSIISGTADGAGLALGTYADDITCLSTTGSNGIVDIYNNQQLPTNTSVSAVWSTAYQQVYMANSIIEGMRNSKSLSAQVKDRITGEALFIRSLIYFYLYQIYGEVPYTDTTDYVHNTTLGRMPMNSFLVRLETDLSEAVNLLPSAYRNAERIYVNKAVGYVLLAKLKMNLGKWQEAELLCQTILQTSGYTFQSDLSKGFLKSSPHIIWQLKPKNNNDPTKEATVYNFVSAPGAFVLNPDLISAFAANDLRRQYYFTAIPYGSQTNYKQTKYKITTATNTTEYSVIYRLEDVYLMMAETLVMQNRVSAAIPFINRTRQRAGLSALASTISREQAMAEMRDERRREFFIEHGSRFLDLKRWGQLDLIKRVKPNWQTFHQYWPLPQKEMLLNANLNPQNDGY